jgi:hypothetical protein
MALYDELPVYKATYDLLVGIFAFTKDFGKEYKYTVCGNLKKVSLLGMFEGFPRSESLHLLLLSNKLSQ